jgi:peptidoglycan/LPS O-acetylase OafA/YrhL
MIATGAAIYQARSEAVEGTLFNFILSANLWEFLLGVLSGYLYGQFRKKLSASSSLLITIVAGALLLAISIAYIDPIYHLVYGLISFVLVLVFTSYEYRQAFNNYINIFFKYTGDASYAIYIFGPIVTFMIGDKNMNSKILIIIITLVLSILTNKLLEEVLLKLSRRNLYRLFSSRIERYKVDKLERVNKGF